MATLSKGHAFSGGETVTATKLNNLVDSATISNIVNADINASAAIAHGKLANITAGQVLLGNASNVPTATALTGDVTVSNTGVTAIGSGVIVNADVSASAAIAGTKVSPNFGSQNIATTGTLNSGGTVIAGSSGTPQLRAGTQAEGFLEVNAFNSGAVFCVVGGTTSTSGVFGTQTNIPVIFYTNNTERLRISNAGDLQFADSRNIVFNATTGTKIGTATSQKLAFYNATPIVQPAAAAQAAAAAQTQDAVTDSTGGTASTTLAAITAGAAYAQADMTAVRNALASISAQLSKIRTDVANIKTLQDAKRTALVDLGLIKGAA